MGFNTLLLSDLHLNDSLETEYRWGIFDFIRHLRMNEETPNAFKNIFILGDITDQKDRHSGKLVNRIVDHLVELSQYHRIYILRGNHDGLDPEWPYFRFLNHFENISFIKDIARITIEDSVPLHFYAHGYSSQFIPNPHGISFFHETFRGVVYKTGQVADGEHLTDSKFGTLCFSGDIHEPQQVGDVVYVGSQYHTRFGDEFNPRAILLDIASRKYESIPVNIGKKITLTVNSPEEFIEKIAQHPSDMVRVQIPDSKEATKLFQYISASKKDYPSIQQIHIVKEGAEQLPSLVATPRNDSELIHEYGKIKNLPTERVEIGVKIHADN